MKTKKSTLPSKNLNNPFIAFKHKNFQFYWIGFFISALGRWMQNIAQPWLAYELTDSPLLLSFVSLAQLLPVLLFSLFAGVIVDRYPKKNILLITQFIPLLTSLVIALLVWIGEVQYWHLFVSACIIGTCNSIDNPARQSFYIELVGRPNLMNAVALCSSAFNVARILGPLIAGWMMVYFNIAWCFFANGASFFFFMICLLFIKPIPMEKMTSAPSMSTISLIKEGIAHIIQRPILLFTLMGVSIMGVFAFNFPIMLPVLVDKVLHQDGQMFSIFMSCMGAGSLIGAFIIASTSGSGPRPYTATLVPFGVGIMFCLTGMISMVFPLGLLMIASGLCSVLFTSSANSRMQLSLEETYRGRVMSIYTLLMQGSGALGSLLIGFVMEHIGVQPAYIVCGASVIILTVLLLIAKNNNLLGLKNVSLSAKMP